MAVPPPPPNARLELPVSSDLAVPPMPFELVFNPENPSLHYRTPLSQGVVPISAYELQKAIYEKGQRYIKKWNIKTKKTKAEERATVLVGIFLLLFVVLGGLVWWRG
jgi:hypothetical protein